MFQTKHALSTPQQAGGLMTKRAVSVGLTVVGLLLSASAWAQMTPVGRWQTIDDETGQAKSEVVISEVNGALVGKVDKLLRADADPSRRCTACTDDRKDQLILGMEIIRGAKKVEGKAVWEDGKILDPENGKTYNLRLTPQESGQKLDVRGSILFIGRTQTWHRVAP